MSIFHFSKIDLKKTMHSFTSASALPIYAGLPLCCGWAMREWSRGDHYAADVGFGYIGIYRDVKYI